MDVGVDGGVGVGIDTESEISREVKPPGQWAPSCCELTLLTVARPLSSSSRCR